MSKDTEPALCARCSEPAVGYATIDGERYCHDDERSCYTAALWERGRQHAQGGVVRHPGRVYLEGTRIRVGAHLPQERLSVTLAREHVNDGFAVADDHRARREAVVRGVPVHEQDERA